jgi:hypothetical protein
MIATTIEKIKKGSAFQFSENGKLFIADGYNRFTKKYSYTKYSDINGFGEKKKGTVVFID